MRIEVKRIYEKPEKTDGFRVLVDRLWPRGLSKEKADIDLWLKEISTSTELRKWFGHDPDKWKGFQTRYRAELRKNRDAVSQLQKIAHQRNVTLLYGARDQEHNEALVLQKFLASHGTAK